jgi:hypothetical protein
LDYDFGGVLAVRVRESVSSLIDLHTDVARILGVKNSVLRITYADSGSNILLGFVGAAMVINALRLLLAEYWERVKFQRYAEFDRATESADKGLTLNKKIQEQVAAKALSEEEAKILRERVLSRAAQLIGNGTTLPLESSPEILDQRKLLADKRDIKLGVGEAPGEKPPEETDDE